MRPEAEKCFDVFDEVWRPVLRRDPYKLEVTKHRVSTLLKNGLPESEDIRQEVLRMLGVMRDNTLREDWTNNLFAGVLYYSLGDRENGMKCVEINIDFGYENDISLAMLQQMRNSIDPSALARDTLRGRRLNDLISGLNERYEKWVQDYKGKMIIIEADNLDFLNRPEDFAQITDRIDAELYGLF